MATQGQIPGGPYVFDVGVGGQIPGGPYVNETAGGAPPTFNPAWARNSNTVIVVANAGSDQK